VQPAHRTHTHALTLPRRAATTPRQRYIIRIIFMVPVYATGSFCSLQWRHGAIYFDTLRDW
jgi:hypothetical protein